MSGVSLHADPGRQSVVTPMAQSTTPTGAQVADSARNGNVGVNLANNSSVVNAIGLVDEGQVQDPSASLNQIADALTQTMSMMKKGLEFNVDEQGGRSVVSVVDVDSGELIRQIPTEEALALAEKMSEVAGLLMKTEA
ncbi:flagellar protein FlaG [Shewanella sp. A3A]|nr:flagellar protein FlaG [Shewanella ferrihydritica]